LSQQETVRPAFRWLLAGLTLLMAVFMLWQGIARLTSDAPVQLGCGYRQRWLCEAGVAVLGLLPATTHGPLLGAVAFVSAAFMAWITWVILPKAPR
jgi:hypothetical protein